MKKRVILITIIGLFLLMLPLMAGAEIVDSGTCGENLTWTLTDEGVLTISGSGAMNNYYGSDTPWYEERESVYSVIIGSGVTSIGGSAFYECSRLSNISIAPSVTSIGTYAFEGCTKVGSVAIPASVTNIGYRAFLNCNGLRKVTISNTECVIGDNSHDVFDGCSASLTITGWSGSTAETYAAAANHAFESLGSTSGQIGDSVYYTIDPSIGTVNITGTGPMWDYSSSSEIPFYSNYALNSVTIGSGVTSIGDGVFWNCQGLASVTIPNSVTSIGSSAFRSCSSLTSVTIPSSVTSIGSSAFRSCSSLTSVTIPSSVTSLGDGAFWDCISLSNVTIPSSVTSIGYSAFKSCSSLTSVTIPNSVTSIGGAAFALCSSLTGITIPGSVTSIGEEVFYKCSSLTSVTIPNSVTGIGYWAFGYCTSLTSVTIHNPECVIGNSDYNVFKYCAAGLKLRGHAGSTTETYANAAGHSFEAITAEMGTPDFTLPSYLTAIEAEAFSGIRASIVYIPDSVTSLGSKAFANCTNLTQIRIPASITVIPPDVFYGLTSTQLKNITVFGAPGSAAETYANGKGMKFEVE